MTSTAQSEPLHDACLEFGPFRYSPARRALSCNGELIPLGGPESALLDMLLKRPGALVGKDELAAAMWPERTVAECNLRWQVASLRRRIGCGKAARYIGTVSGRGYRFVAPVGRDQDAASVPPGDPWPAHDMTPIPLVSRMFGRERELAGLRRVLGAHRLLTVAGPGGIGKTTIALTLAHEWQRDASTGAIFVDLSGARAGDDVASLVAAALGMPLLVRDMLGALAAHLRGRRILLILDSCETAVASVAAMTGRLLGEGRDIHILATSREPLGCPGEYVARLGPLELPPCEGRTSLATLRGYGATALFLDRIGQSGSGGRFGGFCVQPDDANDIAKICARLGGHALAIELAAGQVAALGIAGLARFLDDHFLLEMTDGDGRLPRHRTLALAFGWSYDLLSAGERHLLLRISRFEGHFDLAAIRFMAADASGQTASAPTMLAGLVRKSLVVAEESATGARYHLLDPIRAFAAERLAATGDPDRTAARHAAYMFQALDEPEQFARQPDAPRNVAAALDWAERSEGGHRVAVALTLAATPLWNELSMLEECVYRTRRAIATVERQGGDDATLCALHQALVAALAATGGHGAELAAASERLCDLAAVAGPADALLKGLWGRWVELLNGDKARDSRRVAEMFGEQARRSDQPLVAVTADRMLGMSLHLEGAQDEALTLLDSTLPVFAWPERNRSNLPYHFDQRIVVLAYRARATLLAGEGEQGLRMAAAACAEAEDMRHRSSMALALSIGHLPVALLAGRLELASRLVGRLRALADESGISSWRTVTRGLEGWVAASAQRTTITDINRALADVHDVTFGPTHAAALAALAAAAGRAGHPETGLDVVASALVAGERTGTRWCEPELLRVRAELLVDSRGSAGIAEAHRLLDRGEALAEAQGAHFWVSRIQATRPVFAV